jgi:undecaprenyl-diphosphatase
VITYFQAVCLGLLQGVTELFPISSLGHSILVPALIGGSWRALVTSQTQASSPFLAFIVALHVATAVAMAVYCRRDWRRIGRGLVTSVRSHRIEGTDERLAWRLIAASIPVGLVGLVLEHPLRTLFAKPLAAAVFLTLNGVMLLAGETARRHGPRDVRDIGAQEAVTVPLPLVPSLAQGAADGGDTLGLVRLDVDRETDRQADTADAGRAADSRLARLPVRDAVLVGTCQIAALCAGISRSGATIVGGLTRGLSHEDAARFAFLLATPVILAAGLYKIPDLLGPAGRDVRGQALVGALAAGAAAYVAVRFLDRYFRSHTLTPFAVYSLLAGGLCVIRFGFF